MNDPRRTELVAAVVAALAPTVRLGDPSSSAWQASLTTVAKHVARAAVVFADAAIAEMDRR